MERCQICDQTSDGRFSSNPYDPPKGLKFFSVGHLLVCSECEFPQDKKEEMEEGELPLLDEDWDR